MRQCDMPNGLSVDDYTTTSDGKYLTVIITTSPVPTAPSTELITAVLDSYKENCPYLLTCHVIMVFDTYDQITDKARLKKGQVTADLGQAYGEYKDNVKAVVIGRFCKAPTDVVVSDEDSEAEYGSDGRCTNVVHFRTSRTHDQRVTFVEPAQRLGFGLAVRTAIRLAATPYVWIQQHDWALIADIPIGPILQIMRGSESKPDVPVKYVCLPSIRMLGYANSDDVTRFQALRDLTSTLNRTFPTTSQLQGIPLTPLFFWHDKPHIASTSHYLNVVFPSSLSMQRGSFIEDSTGQIARTQMKEGNWQKWACWLYYPEDGKKLCLRHLQGRLYKGSELEAEMKTQRTGQSRKAGLKAKALARISDDR